MSSDCRICGCVDEDCTWCIVLSGEPCFWTYPDLCSACFSYGLDDEQRAKERGRHVHDLAMLRGNAVPGKAELLQHRDQIVRVWARLNVRRMRCEKAAS